MIYNCSTKNGVTIAPSPSGVLCVVGGNNVGKSQFLRDIPACLQKPRVQQASVLVENVDIHMSLDSGSATEWFLENSIGQDRGGMQTYKAPGGKNHVAIQDFQNLLVQNNLGPIVDWFVRSLDAAERSAVATIQAGSGNVRDKSNALSELFRDGDLEAALSTICEKAFGFPLTLDRANGNVMLRVGAPDIPAPSIQHPTREYSDKV